MHGKGDIYWLQRIRNIHQHIFIHTIKLAANYPEDNAIALVNEFTALTIDPIYMVFVVQHPLPIHIDCGCLSILCNADRLCSAIFHNLENLN